MIVFSVLSRSTFLGGSLAALIVTHRNLTPASNAATLDDVAPISLGVQVGILSAKPQSVEGIDTASSSSLATAARTVRSRTSEAIAADPTIAGPLLRLAFHDATTRESGGGGIDRRRRRKQRPFTGGSNGSVRYEVEWSENRAISRPLAVVERIYSEVSDLGEGSPLSFADAVALSGAAAIECAGGPRVSIRLGRIDTDAADAKTRRRPMEAETQRSRVEGTMPSAGLDSDGLRLYFSALGLTEEEFVALCGAHDLGRHVTLLGMPKPCLRNLTRECLEDAPVSVPFVYENPDTLSNVYFQKLLRWYDREVERDEVAFIPTDVALVVDEGLRPIVKKYAIDEEAFFRQFYVGIL